MRTCVRVCVPSILCVRVRVRPRRAQEPRRSESRDSPDLRVTPSPVIGGGAQPARGTPPTSALSTGLGRTPTQMWAAPPEDFGAAYEIGMQIGVRVRVRSTPY